LLLIPVGAALALLAAFHLIPPFAHADFVRCEVIAVKLGAFAGCALAASAFSRRDYLWRAWVIASLSYLLLAGLGVPLGPPAHSGPTGFSHAVSEIRGVVVLVANVAAVVGAVLLARAWQVAGIALPGSRLTQRSVLAAAAIVAITIGGHSVFVDVKDIVG